MAHSRFSPSATERDTACPPSFLLNEMLPDRNSVDSAHGTAAHYVADKCLKADKDAEVFAGCRVAVGPKGECTLLHEKRALKDDEMEFDVDDEMVNGVQLYLDLCREPEGDHFYEVRVDHTDWCPDKDEHGEPLGQQFGTADHVCCAPRVLYVDDLKYGKGVKVFAKGNKQALKYALGTWKEYDWIYGFEKVVIRIIQPRLDHVDVWELTVDEMLEWGAQIKADLTKVFDPKAAFGPGEKQCKFCKVSGRCKPQEVFIHSITALAFDDESKDGLAPPDFANNPNILTFDEMEEAWRMLPLLKLRMEAIETRVRNALMDEEPFPGLKLVEGNTHRKWHSEKKAQAWLKKHGVPQAKLYKKKFASPAEAERLLPAAAHKELTEANLFFKPRGGPVIADAQDKRPQYQVQEDHIDAFDNEDDGLD